MSIILIHIELYHILSDVQPKTWNVVPKPFCDIIRWCYIVWSCTFILLYYMMLWWKYTKTLPWYIVFAIIVYSIDCGFYHFPTFSTWMAATCCMPVPDCGLLQACVPDLFAATQVWKNSCGAQCGCKDSNRAPTGITHLVQDFFHQLYGTMTNSKVVGFQGDEHLAFSVTNGLWQRVGAFAQRLALHPAGQRRLEIWSKIHSFARLIACDWGFGKKLQSMEETLYTSFVVNWERNHLALLCFSFQTSIQVPVGTQNVRRNYVDLLQQSGLMHKWLTLGVANAFNTLGSFYISVSSKHKTRLEISKSFGLPETRT